MERREPGPVTNLIEIMKDYIDIMIKDNDKKALILDEETLGFVSIVYSRSTLLDKQVYFFDRIDKITDENLRHLVGIFFLRNTPDNITKLKHELKHPKFKTYSLYFSTPVVEDVVKELAEADKAGVVTDLKEVFGDFYAVNPELFTFNMSTSMDLLTRPFNWGLET